MSFSDILKGKTLSSNTNTGIAMATMSLAETENTIAAYSGEEVFQKSDKYLWYDEYYDDKYSTIDHQKNVKISEDQVNLTQEENSQIIPFMMNRYYDGIDLTKMFISIYFVNKENKDGEDPAINVEYSDTKIRFYWKVDGKATYLAGKLKLEIRATGVNEKNEKYVWKTKTNEEINILQSLSSSGTIEPGEGWTSYLEIINQSVIQAQTAAEEAKNAVSEAQQISADVDVKIDNVSTIIKDQVLEEMSTTLLNYYTKEEVDDLLANIDISSQLDGLTTRVKTLETEFENFDGLANLSFTYDKENRTLTAYNGEEVIDELVLSSDPSAEWVATYNTTVDNKITDAITPVQEDLNAYKAQTDADLKGIHENIDNLPSTLESDYYNKESIDTLLADKANTTALNEISTKVIAIETVANTNKDNISTIGNKVAELEETIGDMNQSQQYTYDVKYNDTEDADVGENVFAFYEIQNEGQENEVREIKQKFTIVGGSGGSSTSSSLKIEYVTKTPLVVTVDDKALISFKFSGTDSSGDAVLEGQATWKVAGNVVATSTVVNGENTFDITDYLTIGTQKVQLSVTDDAGSLVTKNWTVQKIDVRLESTFNDKLTYPLGDISFDYTPYGAISKEVHFILDGKEIGTVTTSASGIPMGYTLPAQEHGSHLLEAYISATVNGNTVESNHVVKDIIWYDSNSSVPVISTIYQQFTSRQYDATNIEYTVYDPTTETPTVEIAVDGVIVSIPTLDSATNTYSFKTSEVGEHIITITCGVTIKTIKAIVTKLDIEVEPVTAGLMVDFNPVGKSNSDADRIWTNGTYSLSVSDNFDWINGGYQIDDKGDQYFCIKAGTSVDLDYKMFADDAKRNGKEMKLIFKTTNVQEANAQFLSCIDNTTETDHIGVEMFAHEAFIYGSADKLHLKYSENDIIEFEFNITKNTEKVTEICGYEDGVPTRHLVYDDTFNFTQSTPKVIKLGSDKCDLHIYRLKIYNTSLTNRGVLSNFIADARNAEEMINRYNRNQIYNENQELTPEILAEKCPWLRVYVVSAPYFTNKKSDKVPYTTIKQIYKDGDPILDNWTCYDASHSGQGTSSDNYGAAARNLDFIMNKSQREGVEPYFILGDGKTRATEISLTRTSIPNAYFNFKANVASSNHFTNALLAKRYNTFNPYVRPFVRDDESIIDYIKDTMEFHNAVVFIQETDPDLSTHREFADNLIHFYSIGNIGDSKKTDISRLTDPSDRYEFINEICDVELPLSDWKNTPEALSALEAEKFDKSGTYEWRYIWEDGTDEENAEVFEKCKSAWIEMYKFVTQSTDEEFKTRYEEYFVKDSILYYYLFTTRYCMADNRAKNLFPHFGKTGIYRAISNPVAEMLHVYCELSDGKYISTTDTEIDNSKTYYTQYAFDLSFDYDNDTAMSLNNYGNSVYRHGYEDTDTLDATDEEVFRESDSTFFCRVRDLFAGELKEMYNTLESKNAWHAESFLNEIEEWQNQFPEELWRLDCERKYIRSYSESFINGAGDHQYLKNMAQGKMKYTIKQWERSQEAYMASKYQSSVASSDNAVLRCTVPTGDLVVPVNYRLKLTPYDYMYLNVKYGTQEPIQLRANPGIQYEIPFEGDSVDILDIYSASRIQDLGDLSTTYPATIDTAKATRLKELHIGNATEGYDNPYLTTMTLGANYLLEVLNVENVPGLTQSLNLSALNNLRELYAHGTNTSGVTFASGGAIQIAELPAITALSAKNLSYLTDLDVTSYDNLTTLTVENCSTLDIINIFGLAENLNRVRITGIDWILSDDTLLDRIYRMSGIDKNGYNIGQSVLAGKVHVPVIRQQQLIDYKKAWSDLEVTFDTMIEQYPVTFKNYDGSILEVQYVDKGGNAVDPTTRAENPLKPTKSSTVSHDFTFAGWDSSLTDVFSERTITATYAESLRRYTIKYVSKGITMQESTGLYGENIPYTGVAPTYTGEESGYVYYLFNRWDKSGFIDGEKTVNAIFDKFEYTSTAFDGKELSDLSPVEIYAMNKLNLAESIITDKDPYSFTIGNDIDYDDIESELLISEKTYFNGSNYLDTGIQLFAEDRDFVLAIDYEFLSGNKSNAVLAQCYQANGTNGFKLWYSSASDFAGAKFTWGTTSDNVVAIDKREIIVIRHKKGDNNLTIYKSNLDGDAVVSADLTRTKTTAGTGTLVFGCARADDGIYENYAIGNINWAKVWFADLGDDTCKSLAMWTHESITLEACGFRKYYLTDNTSKRCSFSLLASHLLGRTKKWNVTNTNAGGWANSELNSSLNDRLYNAIPTQIKALLKQVIVYSSIGQMSTELSSSNCYITIPAVVEVDSYMTSEPYNSEGTAISYLNTNESRKRAFDGGDYSAYWLRSPNNSYANYIWRVDDDGSTQGITNATSNLGVLIEISF